MKKLILAITSLLLFSCSSSDDAKNDETVNTVKLVKVVEVDNNDNETSTTIFNYNGNNVETTITTDFEGIFKTKYIFENGKLVKLERYTNNIRKVNEDLAFTYESDLISTSFGYDGSTTLYTNKYTYNTKGQVISKKQYDNDKYCCETTFTYDAIGNINSQKHSSFTAILSYTYDDKKNPSFYLFPEAYSKIKEISKNNLLSDGTSTYAYEYNEEGFVTKKTETHKYLSKTIVTNYYYE